MARRPFDSQRRRSDDMTLDEFLRERVRRMVAEEIERSREDVLA